MLLAILALYFIHHQATGVYTFEYSELLGTHFSSGVELWIMLGFFVAFAVKLPVVGCTPGCRMLTLRPPPLEA